MKNTVIGTVSVIVFIGAIAWLVTTQQSGAQIPKASLPLARVAINMVAPNASFTNLQNRSLKLSSFREKKVMLWLVATWCSSCSEGAIVLAQNESKLSNLTIITLKTYGNAGYAGPSIEKFASESAPNMLRAKNWVWGNITQQSARVYNPRNYPDIYFLIDKHGVVRNISDAPAATIGTILKFAGG